MKYYLKVILCGALVGLLGACDYLPREAKLDLTPLQLKGLKAEAAPIESAVLEAFKTHSLVAIGDYHWNKKVMMAITQLVINKTFNKEVRHVVVEFGNSRHQKMLDDYLAGEKVSDEQIARVYRDAIFFTAWMPEVYGNFFKAVRQHNLTKAENLQIKVTLAETAFHWENITQHKQWRAAADHKTDGFMQTIEQAMQANKKTLLIFGAFHLLKIPQDIAKHIPDEKLPLATRLEKKYNNSVYSIWPLTRTEITQPLSFLADNTVLSTQDTALKNIKFIDVLPKARIRLGRMDSRDLLLPQLVDGVLYVGETRRADILPKTVYQDEPWMQEMTERIDLIGGKLKGKFDGIVKNSRLAYE